MFPLIEETIPESELQDAWGAATARHALRGGAGPTSRNRSTRFGGGTFGSPTVHRSLGVSWIATRQSRPDDIRFAALIERKAAA